MQDLPSPSRSGEPCLTLFVGEEQDDLAPLLTLPVVGALDLGCAAPAVGLAKPPAGLVLRVSTATALRLDIAGPFTAALCARVDGARRLEDCLHLAIQEAIGNAVMHGNLALDGALRATSSGWRLFSEQMQEQAQNPLLTRRAITLTAHWDTGSLVVAVQDLGWGFDSDVPHPAGLANGRGLGLIRGACCDVAFADQGRRIEMCFALR